VCRAGAVYAAFQGEGAMIKTAALLLQHI
jgi:hypothetical protein